MKKIITLFFVAVISVVNAQDKTSKETSKWTGNRPDGHAPTSVMADHTHGKGEVMFSYRYMNMNMEGLKRGDSDVPFSNALEAYMVTPTRMQMEMQMLGAMYAPSDRVTLLAMVNYISLEMDHVTRMGGEFTTESSGFGDTKVGALYKLFNRNRQSLHAKLVASLPTGSIDELDQTPASAPNEVILPYPMQIGSGTLDFEMGGTYLWQLQDVSGGSQLNLVLRTGENDNSYRLGNRYDLNNWIAYKASPWLSFSARIQGLLIAGIEGENPLLNPMMVTTADTQNSGGTFVNGGLGFNFYVPHGELKNIRFGLEWAMPLYQDVNGVQLKTQETISGGIQYSF